MTDDQIFNNRYRLERRIGDGGMAVVYAGTDMLLRRRVAIKVLREQFAADDDFVRRFYNEAQSAAKLSHPNIVNTYDVGRENSTYFIVMELVEGTTLGEMIRADGKIPEPVAIDYAAQICNGLAYAHRQGLLHRDIKPANILITHDDVVKLSDFGIARAVTQQTLTVTQPGMVMGSVYYISPEQAQGFELRETSDLYSAGVVLYQMLLGKLPYLGDSPVTVALKHVSERPPTLDAASTGISPALCAIVERLLQKDPHDRFHSASEVASALREARERPMVASAAPGTREGTTAPIPTVTEGGGPGRPPPRRSQAPDSAATSNGAGAAVFDAYAPAAGTGSWNLARYVALGIVLVLAVAGGYALWGGAVPFLQSVQLADERGRSAVEAQRDLEGAGLHAKISGIPSDNVPQDEVVRQNPEPGSRVARGSEVQLFVSTGLAPKQLVSVNDFTAADAQRTLEQQGFKTKIVARYSNDKAKGTVLAMTPRAGEMVKPGSVVTLTVSNGPAPVVVPDLVNHSIGDAQAALAKAALKVNVQRVPLDGVPTDQVASQDPIAGTKVDAGTTVTLTVSSGPALVAVPDVGGKSASDASDALVAAGFAPKITYTIQAGSDGSVFAQDPAPSSQARKGATVNVMVAVPGTVPDVTGLGLDAAKAMLIRLGYKPGNVSYVQEGQDGTVARTEPAAHAQLNVGETVSLYVNGASR
ncbi:MAG: Stk1 family PASTA domain-containing Ser/Thr kinase [Candidatus Eremiobacteraeota bacterium]|nr:Stk1 family PASTA domain-containing Ser/Thr kinase [Candidatus Eremiobacteraeota bacterium]